MHETVNLAPQGFLGSNPGSGTETGCSVSCKGKNMFGKKSPEQQIEEIRNQAEQDRTNLGRDRKIVSNCETKPMSKIFGPNEETIRGCADCIVNPIKCPVNKRIRGGSERLG